MSKTVKPKKYELCLMWEPIDSQRERDYEIPDGKFTLFAKINGKSGNYKRLYANKDVIVMALCELFDYPVRKALTLLHEIMNPKIKRQKYSVFLWNREADGRGPDYSGYYIKSIKGNKTVIRTAADVNSLRHYYETFEYALN